MREFRKNQRLFKTLMNFVVIFTAIFMFVYIGIYPMVIKPLGDTIVQIFTYISDGLVIVSMVLLFMYYTKYGKCNATLELVEAELEDAGYYLIANDCINAAEYIKLLADTVAKDGYVVEQNVDVDELDVELVGIKSNNFVYCVDVTDVDRNDLVAYLDAVTYDITVKYLRRKGNAIIVFVTNKAQEDAVALAKMVTALGKKGQLKIAFAIAELESGRCYFLGNKQTKCQQMIANYVLGCNIPIDKKYIADEKLPCQQQLEEHMKSFNLKEFRDGKFLIH